jgi:hypothetical protein
MGSHRARLAPRMAMPCRVGSQCPGHVKPPVWHMVSIALEAGPAVDGAGWWTWESANEPLCRLEPFAGHLSEVVADCGGERSCSWPPRRPARGINPTKATPDSRPRG